MNVIITDFAKERIKKIYYYYKDRGLSKIGQKIRIDIVTKAKFLKQQPYMGPIEPHSKNIKKKYRYIVSGTYKIIYRVKPPNIYIVEVFDTRQNPDKMKI